MKEDSFTPTKISYTKGDFSPAELKSLLFGTTSQLPFTVVSKNNISLGFQSKPVWLRLEAVNQTNSHKILLDLGNAHLDHVTVYETNKELPVKTGGDFIPHSQWDAFSKTIAFELDWPIGETKTFYIKTETSSNISYSVRFFSKETFYLKENIENTTLGFFYGTIFIMVLYNLFIYFILKDKAYILYSLAIFCNLILQMYLNGILNQFITIDHPEIHNRVGSVIVCFAVVFGWRFAQQTLNTKVINPYWHLIIRGFIVVTLFYLFVLLQFLPLPILIRVGNFLAQLFVFSVFTVALFTYNAGNRQARLFLLGWSTLLFGILLYTLMQNGLLPANLITIYSNQIGSTLEAGILSLALASKINQLKDEKSKAQSEALSTLEDKVRERTKNLDASLNSIRKDLSVAKKIQQTFFSQIKAEDPRIKFDSFYQSMNEVGGDFYDLAQVNPDYYRIFIADATGHGIQAALITMAIKAEYESLKIMYDHPNDLIFHLNQIFINKYNKVQTIFTCAVCDIDLKKRKLHFASAGHPDQIHIRAGEKKILPRTGRIIGMADHTEYRSIEHFLEEGDRIYLFTDGIFEQFNESREIFGEKKVYEILQDIEKHPFDDSISHLVTELNKFTNFKTDQDDITLIGCEIESFGN